MTTVFFRIGNTIRKINISIIIVFFIILPGSGTLVSSAPSHNTSLQQSNGSHPQTPTTIDPDIVTLLQHLDETLIRGYIGNITAFGPRVSGTENANNTARYLFSTFQQMGLSVRYQNFSGGFATGSNVEATLYGTDRTNIFIISAHYDSIYCTLGADDDASGIAAVLAAAELMRQYPWKHTIRFVCFSGEEQGVVGSCHYAQEAYTNKNHIVAVLNADMIGFATTPADSTKGKIFDNAASAWIVSYTQNISQLYQDFITLQIIPQGPILVCDHQFFWEYSYDAVTYHEYHFNEYYHTPGDTLDHMNLDYTTQFSRLMLATLAEMANQPMNTPPIADAGLNQFTYTGERVQVNGADSFDGDSDPLTYNWSFLSTPFGSIAAFSDATSINPSFIVDKTGTYTIQLIVNDGIIDSFPDTVSIRTQNRPPYPPTTPDPPHTATNISTTPRLQWIGGDPDNGDTVTYDVYLADTFPLEKHASNLTTPMYEPGTLEHNHTYFWSIVAWDHNNASTKSPCWEFTTTQVTNTPPQKPRTPSGKTQGTTHIEYIYTSTTTDPENDPLYYKWDWGDGTQTSWLGPYTSGDTINTTHTWDTKGSYQITIKAKDNQGHESPWSDPLPITMPSAIIKPLHHPELFMHWFFQKSVKIQYSFYSWIRLINHESMTHE